MGEKEMMYGVWMLAVAGLVWGLVGVGYFLNTNLNIVNLLLGGIPVVENLVYVIVGVCALSVIYFKLQKKKA